MIADDTRETLRGAIARLAVGDPEYPLHRVLAIVDALAAARRDPETCSGCGVEDNFSKDAFGERCMSCGTRRDPEPHRTSELTDAAERFQEAFRDPEPVASADAALHERIRVAVHDYFERTLTDDGEYGPGCVHFDKGHGAYRLCDDPDQDVPIRALPEVLAAIRGTEARATLDVEALAPLLHAEWDRRTGEPSEPGVPCEDCLDSARHILAEADRPKVNYGLDNL